MAGNIYDCATYEDLVAVLRARLERRAGKRASTRGIAALLGHKSPGAVHGMLTGARLPSSAVATRLVDLLSLSSQEANFLRGWIAYERRRRGGTEAPDDLERLTRLNPRRTEQALLPMEAVPYISSWYYLPLKALVGTPGFRFNLDWIQRRMKGNLPGATIHNGLYLLERLGLLRRDGRKWAVTKAVGTALDVPSAAVRQHHREMLVRAEESLDADSVEVRDVSSTTLRFDPARMQEAKTVLEDFRQEFFKRFEHDDAPEVYQLNMQLFPHTVLKNSRVKAPK